MSNASIGLLPDISDYLRRVGLREPEILRRLREETASIPEHSMQIAPEQGALLGLLVQLMGARRCLEIGTFTGYSSLAVALALPAGGTLLCCDVSEEWTAVARRYWAEAGVDDRVELRLAPALETLDGLLAAGRAGTFDFAFVDADKPCYPDYHERVVELLRPGGLAAYDNVLWAGRIIDPTVTDEGTEALRALNERIATDERVTVSMVPIGDGLTLALKR